MMLRNHLYLFGAICLASFVFVVRARDREAIVRHVAFGLVLLVAWAIPTMLGSFSPFFTQTFVVLLLFCAVLAVGDVMPRVSIGGPRSPWITRVAVAGAVVLPFVGMASRTSGVAPDPANDNKITNWCKDYYDALHPYSAGGAYVNFMMEEGQERVRASYRDNYDRLVEIKSKYDPKNLFRVNQNLRPVTAMA